MKHSPYEFSHASFFVDLGGQYTQGLGGDRYRRVGINGKGYGVIIGAVITIAFGLWYFT